MKIYRLQKAAQFNGANYTHLIILGTKRTATGGSDFTDADGSQDFNFLLPAAGDVLLPPAPVVYTKRTFAGTGLSAVAVSVGYTGALTAYVSAADGKTKGNVCPGNSATLQKAFDGSTYLAGTVATTGCNLNALTDGEIWIYACLAPIGEMLNDRYG